jgi:protein gp37
MGENTKIEWCDHSWNPWVGCTKISPACDHCYAEGWAKRTGQSHLWAGERRRTTASNWRQPIKWNRLAETDCVRRKVFCASLADIFDNQVPEQWRADLWATITATPHLDWLLLTKRPQNIYKMLPTMLGDGWPNVWLGSTVENADEERRIRYLRDVPATVRFLSCEPLLSPICPDLSDIHWVIGGGESGGGARQSDPGWFRALRDHCASQGIAYFHKQMTRKASIPDDLMVREFPQ